MLTSFLKIHKHSFCCFHGVHTDAETIAVIAEKTPKLICMMIVVNSEFSHADSKSFPANSASLSCMLPVHLYANTVPSLASICKSIALWGAVKTRPSTAVLCTFLLWERLATMTRP
jgi:hypothetical protein